MPLWFVRGLRRGVVTTRYPARPDASSGWLPTPPAFRPAELDRETADQLIQVCPSGALSREKGGEGSGEGRWVGGGVLVFDVGACTACGLCAEAAPHAVTPSGEFELATTIRSGLIKKIPLAGEARKEGR